MDRASAVPMPMRRKRRFLRDHHNIKITDCKTRLFYFYIYLLKQFNAGYPLITDICVREMLPNITQAKCSKQSIA